ncbi:MAG: hypothetical protein WC548_03410 [Candidatus Pacearchaeota archaeon]
MWWFFSKKNGYEKLKEEIQDSFGHVKTDFNKVGEWIKYFDDKTKVQDENTSKMKEDILILQDEINEMRELISFFKPQLSQGGFKQSTTAGDKQFVPVAVQTVVQTPVQTDILDNLTVMERAIVWALLNSEMKLSYEDLAALLGKDKSTIRGQINTIRQKSSALIEEFREINGKKRIFIPEEIKNRIIKSVKIKVNDTKKYRKEKSEG